MRGAQHRACRTFRFAVFDAPHRRCRGTFHIATADNDAFTVSVETGAVLWDYRAGFASPCTMYSDTSRICSVE